FFALWLSLLPALYVCRKRKATQDAQPCLHWPRLEPPATSVILWFQSLSNFSNVLVVILCRIVIRLANTKAGRLTNTSAASFLLSKRSLCFSQRPCGLGRAHPTNWRRK
ncbi:hypothetical protein B0H13DRAFT_2271029, partial [Mycena leptocephala]